MNRIALLMLLALPGVVSASTPTENIGISVLPSPGKITVDGKSNDWDLSGGIFACDNTESFRDRAAVWLHLMYDNDNLYVLADFNDESPMNNPGQTVGDYGFAGDSLQVRFFFSPGTEGRNEKETPNGRVSHWTCWCGRDGSDVLDVAYGQQFNQGSIKDAKKDGAQQAFRPRDDKSGYIQELAIPWKLLTKEGAAPKAGDKFVVTFEPNFSVGEAKARLSVKDCFKGGMQLDRVFTFQGPNAWGWASVEAKGNVPPRAVRLADAREFAVKLEPGKLVVDWTDLVKKKVLPGFKTIALDMAESGYISLNLFRKDGTVARQLLNTEFLEKGHHEIKWDGLSNWSVNVPGKPVEPGEYTWSALVHGDIGLSLVGWACNSGSAPWDGVTGRENWGGDHGLPTGCAADADTVYLGWNAAEAGKALLAVDLDGKIKWKNIREGIAGAEMVAVDNGFVYAVNGNDKSNYLYRLSAKDGAYVPFAGTDSPDLRLNKLWPDSAKDKPQRFNAMDAKSGKLYLAFSAADAVMQVDANTGAYEKVHAISAPVAVACVSPTLVYVLSRKSEIVALNPVSGESKVLITGLVNAESLAVDGSGAIYVGVGEPDQQVKVFGADGKPQRTIGKTGGRAKLGPWTPDGLLFPREMAVDSAGKLWVTEGDHSPKRVSVWNAQDGKFVKEFFGSTGYGALGGAINPTDPYLMVGQGCEWRIDPTTGIAKCLGAFTREGQENARFGMGSNGKLYVATATRWAFDLGSVHIYERISDGEYKLRSTIYFTDKAGAEIRPPEHGKSGEAAKTALWADENGDGQRQPNEITLVDGIVRLSGWYMPMLQDLTFFAGTNRFPCSGFTACGAPKWDLQKPESLPVKVSGGTGSPTGSIDGKFMLCNGEYNVDHGVMRCYDVATGKQLWEYPDNYVGVHGSHNACPPETGMVRGSFGPCGVIKLPPPIGNVWVLATNVGEWHMITDRGFYLAKLFEGDPLKFHWPAQAVPGADMSHCPPGMGGEDFGGSVAQTKDGKVYLQSGKTAYWNVAVTGLENVREVKGTHAITISANDVVQAQLVHDQSLQAAVGSRRSVVPKSVRTFTGNMDNDFKGAERLRFKKSDEAGVSVSLSYDDTNLYLGFEVKDATPWTNGADAIEEMYLRGDTVDLQLATNPKADAKRAEAVAGDLRVSIGNFKGKPTAVVYKRVSETKQPKVFSSGVIKEYPMDFVAAIADAKIQVKTSKDSYIVEAALPLSALGLQAPGGLELRGDIGVTHGDQAGQRARLRTYWNNQQTGIVDDPVFELKMEPKNWGTFIFQK